MFLVTAQSFANEIVDQLQPFCQRIHIAGSIRREKPEVKDIEIVCLPKLEHVPTDLFGEGYTRVVPGFQAAVEKLSHTIIKGKFGGRYMQFTLAKHRHATVDLFTPTAQDYYRQLAIRTGSAEYAKEVIAKSWMAKGWCGAGEDGLRMQKHCIKKPDGWKCINKTDDLPPAWESEEEFFEWLGVAYIQPRFR